MTKITTHVLDTSRGIPAQDVAVVLYQQHADYWDVIAANNTNKEGRITEFAIQDKELTPGIYKLKFETQEYFDYHSIKSFFPLVEIVFVVNKGEHYHLPLLLSPFGYSVYRGS